MPSATDDITRLLIDWSGGDDEALQRLMPLIYEDMQRLAKSYLRRERTDHTLQPCALAHEAYLRLVNQKQVAWQNRAHFLGLAAQAMRRILVDHARKRHAEKRGGEDTALHLGDGFDLPQKKGVDILALEDALESLKQFAPRQLHIVELRFFGGLTIKETAACLRISTSTVKLDWHMAKAWLFQELKEA